MDKDEELLKILGKLSGGSLEDVADKIIALLAFPISEFGLCSYGFLGHPL